MQNGCPGRKNSTAGTWLNLTDHYHIYVDPRYRPRNPGASGKRLYMLLRGSESLGIPFMELPGFRKGRALHVRDYSGRRGEEKKSRLGVSFSGRSTTKRRCRGKELLRRDDGS